MRISCLHMQAKPLTAGSLMIPAANEVCNIIRTGSRRNPPALTKQRLILPRIHGSPMLVVKPQTSTPNASQTHESRNDSGCGKDFPPKAKCQGKLVQRVAWVPMVRSANVRPFMFVDRGIFSRAEIFIERNHRIARIDWPEISVFGCLSSQNPIILGPKTAVDHYPNW